MSWKSGGEKIEPVEGTIEELRAIRDESEIYGLNLERDAAIKQMIDRRGQGRRHTGRRGGSASRWRAVWLGDACSVGSQT